MYVKGFDVSYYSAPAGVDFFTFNLFKADGYRVFAIDLWHNGGINPVARESINAALIAGFKVIGYFELISGLDPRRQIDVFRRELGQTYFQQRAVAIDLELTGITLEQVRLAISEIQSDGLEPIIYTAKWWYDKYGWGSALLEYGLWYANYDYTDKFMPRQIPRGWDMSRVVGKQYADNMRLYNVVCDLNIFERKWVYMQELQEIYDNSMIHLGALWGWGERLKQIVAEHPELADLLDDIGGQIQENAVALRSYLEKAVNL